MKNFNPAATDWNAENAYWLARLSSLAYEPLFKIEVQCQQWGFERVVAFSGRRTDTQCFVASNSEYRVACFRGTEPDKQADLLTDLQIAFRWFAPLGNVHRGFRLAYQSVHEGVVSQLCRENSRPLPVFFTGHSLGGALATLAIAAAPPLVRDTAQLYTFGSPRVMDKDAVAQFQQCFQRRSFRHVNNSDGVCRVPTRLSGYWHVDEPIVADADGVWQRGLGFWMKLVERVKGDWRQWIDSSDLAVVNDHRISEYVRVAQQNLSQEKEPIP